MIGLKRRNIMNMIMKLDMRRDKPSSTILLYLNISKSIMLILIRRLCALHLPVLGGDFFTREQSFINRLLLHLLVNLKSCIKILIPNILPIGIRIQIAFTAMIRGDRMWTKAISCLSMLFRLSI